MENTVDANTRQLLYKAYDYFNKRDIDAALQLMDENVYWPNGMEGGYVSGRQEVRAYWTRQWTMINPHVEIVDLTPEQGTIVAHVRQTVRDLQGKLLFEGMVNHVYFIKNGLITRMDIR